MTDDLTRRLRNVGGFDTDAELCSEAANHIDELREYLYLTAHTLQDFMSFGDGINSPTWKDFCKEVIAHAKKLSKDN